MPHARGPVELVGRVAQQEPEVGLGHRAPGRAPGPRGTDVPPSASVAPADLEAGPAPFQVGEAGLAERPADPVGVVVEVVVAEDRERPEPAAEPRQDRHDPVERVVVVDQVAGEERRGRPPRRAASSATRLEEPAVEARGEVQVAEVDDAQAVQAAGRPGRVDLPLAPAEPQRLVAREPQQPGVPARRRSARRPAARGQVDAPTTAPRSPPGRRPEAPASVDGRAGRPARSPGRARA